MWQILHPALDWQNKRIHRPTGELTIRPTTKCKAELCQKSADMHFLPSSALIEHIKCIVSKASSKLVNQVRPWYVELTPYMQFTAIQKYHFGLTSCSNSVNSLYSYHFPPAAPTGKGGRTKTSTGFGTWTANTISPPLSPPSDTGDGPNGSTVIHPSPDIATSQAGLGRATKKIREKKIFSNHKET